MAPRLVVRADAGYDIGLGHVMRCIAVAQEWQRVGGPVTFAMARGHEIVHARLTSENVDLHVIETDTPEDLAMLAEGGVVLVDSYQHGERFHEALTSARVPSATIDDHVRLPIYHADVVIDPNVCAREEDYRAHIRHGRVLAGLGYALLRREFRTAPKPSRRAGSPRLLITFGGADEPALTERTLGALDTSFDITVVVGAANPRTVEIERSTRRFGHARVLYNPPNMPDLMASTDIAVSSAGTTCTELAFMGVPAVVVIGADNQRRVAAGFERLGSAQVAGDLGVTGYEIASRVQALALDEPARRRMTQRGRAAVDGQGAERVARVLQELC